MKVFNDMEETGCDNQTHPWLSQKPLWKDKGNASTVSLSKEQTWQEPVWSWSQGLEGVTTAFSGDTTLPSKLWLLILRQSCLRYPVFSLPPSSDSTFWWPWAFNPLPLHTVRSVLLNKLVCHKSSVDESPPSPSFCFCLLYFSSVVLSLDTLPFMSFLLVSRLAFGRTWECFLSFISFVENSRPRTTLFEILLFVRVRGVVAHNAIENTIPSALFVPLAINGHACVGSRSSAVCVYLP